MSYRKDDYEDWEVDFDVVVRSTDKAFLVVIENEEIWLPKSQVDLSFNDDAQSGSVVMPMWLARSKELTDE